MDKNKLLKNIDEEIKNGEDRLKTYDSYTYPEETFGEGKEYGMIEAFYTVKMWIESESEA